MTTPPKRRRLLLTAALLRITAIGLPIVLLSAALLSIAVIGLPIGALLSYLGAPTNGVWSHLLPNLLGDYFINSLTLSVGVALLSFVLGTGTAWLCSVCDFYGRRVYRWMLILPLVYPAYIVAYIYTGMLDYGGFFHLIGKTYFGIESTMPIRSMGGAILVITVTLYPYVYMMARAGWIHKSRHIINAGRALGTRPWQVFVRIALPMNRPLIVVGIALVVMETLADYGTVQYFGINTFSIGIIRTWFGLDSLAGAAQLSIILLTFTVALMLLERSMRKRVQLAAPDQAPMKPSYALRGKKALAANVFCLVPILFGFVIPTLQLLVWLFRRSDGIIWRDYFTLASDTIGLALLCAILIILIAVLLAYAKRFYPQKTFRFLAQIASSGYAIPGVVVAVGVLAAAAFVKDASGVVLHGGFALLILGYTTRFLTLGTVTMDAALEKIPHSMDFTARTLKASWLQILTKIHLPIINPSLLAAMLLVLVEIIKELPVTLVLRPFNFNTLAVKTYELAADERITDIALPALSIVVIGLLPLAILYRSMNTGQP